MSSENFSKNTKRQISMSSLSPTGQDWSQHFGLALTLQKRLQHPGDRLKQQAQQLDQLEIHLQRVMRFILQNKQHQMLMAAEKMDTLSPLKTLRRGYSITRLKATQKVIMHAVEVKSGDVIVTRVSDGEIESIIKTGALTQSSDPALALLK